MLDRSRLTRDERYELIHALRDRRELLTDRDQLGHDEATRKDARWRLFVIATLLESLNG